MSTVLQAYFLLENRGVVEARPQSGHYVRQPKAPALPEPRPARLSQAATRVTVSDLVAEVYGAARNPAYVQLGAAHVSPELLPTEKVNRRLCADRPRGGRRRRGYDVPPGYLPLRRQIARRAAECGCALGADDVVTTVGAMEALHLCLRATANAGDTIAVESPAYYGLLQLIESLGMRALEIPTGPDGPRPRPPRQVLRRHRVKACLAVPNFSNPAAR